VHVINKWSKNVDEKAASQGEFFTGDNCNEKKHFEIVAKNRRQCQSNSRLHRSIIAVLFRGPDNPQKLPLPVGNLDPLLYVVP